MEKRTYLYHLCGFAYRVEQNEGEDPIYYDGVERQTKCFHCYVPLEPAFFLEQHPNDVTMRHVQDSLRRLIEKTYTSESEESYHDVYALIEQVSKSVHEVSAYLATLQGAAIAAFAARGSEAWERELQKREQ